VIERCLDAVRRQTYTPIDLIVVDNASQDGSTSIVERLTAPSERVPLDRNTGYSAAHNLAVSRSHGAYYLALNPDVFASPTFVERLVAALERYPRAGAAGGKLLRPQTENDAGPADGRDRLDSTGIFMLPSQRHLDRGAGEVDAGQYGRLEYVFGASGAAALYRRTMLTDTAIDGEIFDESFFAYREDADLAWRAQLLGWRCLYVPEAVARHVRRVTPERRAGLPAAINRFSVRNRFLLRLKNQTAGEAVRFAGPALLRDLQVLGYVALREWSSLPALADVARLLPSALRKRRAIMSRRRVSSRQMQQWFRQTAEPTE
jgi:GT2 family glycosyltransferase